MLPFDPPRNITKPKVNHNFIFLFLVLIVQLLKRNSSTHKKKRKKKNFLEQIFAMKPISVIFAEFNFTIRCQNLEINFSKISALKVFTFTYLNNSTVPVKQFYVTGAKLSSTHFINDEMMKLSKW